MDRKQLLIGLLTASLSTLLPIALHGARAATPKAATTAPAANEMPIYGSQLMTDAERTAFRARMWAAQSDEERNRIRAEHHEEMKKRAQAKGMTLPDMPPAMPGGPGSGPGMMRQGMGAAAMPPCAASAASAITCPASSPRSGGRQHHRRYHAPARP